MTQGSGWLRLKVFCPWTWTRQKLTDSVEDKPAFSGRDDPTKVYRPLGPDLIGLLK